MNHKSNRERHISLWSDFKSIENESALQIIGYDPQFKSIDIYPESIT